MRRAKLSDDALSTLAEIEAERLLLVGHVPDQGLDVDRFRQDRRADQQARGVARLRRTADAVVRADTKVHAVGVAAGTLTLSSELPGRTEASRIAQVRARCISIRWGYCCHGPCLPRSPARFASAMLNCRTTFLPSARVRVATAVRPSPCPTK